MDLDGDGHKDLISGSLRGEFYCFRNLGHGQYAPKRLLTDLAGEKLQCGGTSTAAAADWNGDGKIDLIVQGGGEIRFLPGKGPFAFGDPRSIVVEGEPLKIDDGGVHAVDWNGDGQMDLILGAGNGSVALMLFDRIEAGTPQFQAPVTLVEPLSTKPAALHRFAFVGTDPMRLVNPRSGMRAKPAVVDWNGDGKLDLLVGDLLQCETLTRTLTETQQAEKKVLQAQQNVLMDLQNALSAEIQRETKRRLGLDPEVGVPRERLDEFFELRHKVQREHPRYQELNAELELLWEKLQDYQDLIPRYGFVWVYLQK